MSPESRNDEICSVSSVCGFRLLQRGVGSEHSRAEHDSTVHGYSEDVLRRNR